MTKKIGKIYAITLSIGLVYFLWVKLTGLAIPCVQYATTGFLCPGCGISRMFLSMAKLDFVQAFSYNPVVFCLFFYWNFLALLCLWGKPGFIRQKPFLYGNLYATIGILVVYGVLRNIL